MTGSTARSRSYAHRESASSSPPTPTAAASSATCTTACSNISSRLRSTSSSWNSSSATILWRRRRYSKTWDATCTQALEEAAQLAQTIHPPLLETGGLAATLRAAASSIGVPSSVEVAADPGWPPEAVMTVYLCWLDALSGATAGTRMTIGVREAEGALSFEICGSEALPDRLRDRVEALGGELVSSETSVTGFLPL